jgi:hypothetical protein
MNTEAELAHETGTAPPFSPDPGISAQWLFGSALAAIGTMGASIRRKREVHGSRAQCSLVRAEAVAPPSNAPTRLFVAMRASASGWLAEQKRASRFPRTAVCAFG